MNSAPKSHPLLSLSVLAASFWLAGLAQAQGTGSLGAWRDSARQALIPESMRATAGLTKVQQPSVMGNRQNLNSARIALPVHGAAVAAQFRTERQMLGRAQSADSLRMQTDLAAGAALQQRSFEAGVELDTGSGMALGLAAVVAEQHFMAAGLNTSAIDLRDAGTARAPLSDRSSGSGAEISLGAVPSSAVHWRLAYRTRVGMEPLKFYRGVFSDPGDFDLPSQFQAGLGLQFAQNHVLIADVKRVHYGELQPYQSIALPNRFLAQLGDGGSPRFEWRDLTIFSLGWQWQAGAADRLELLWSSSQQPIPTTESLRNALSELYSDRNWSASWIRQIDEGMAVRLGAAYAPVQSYLGPSFYGWRGDGRGDQLEVEARLDWRF